MAFALDQRVPMRHFDKVVFGINRYHLLLQSSLVAVTADDLFFFATTHRYRCFELKASLAPVRSISGSIVKSRVNSSADALDVVGGQGEVKG